MSVDPCYFHKNIARNGLNVLGKILFYTGAGLPYLSYQVWKMRLRWWHPVTWICAIYLFAGGLLVGGLPLVREAYADFFANDPLICKYNYFKAFDPNKAKTKSITFTYKSDQSKIYHGYRYEIEGAKMYFREEDQRAGIWGDHVLVIDDGVKSAAQGGGADE